MLFIYNLNRFERTRTKVGRMFLVYPRFPTQIFNKFTHGLQTTLFRPCRKLHQVPPGLSEEIIATLQLEIGLMPNDVVADIGSGTGLSAKLFLEHGNTVFGVEPNEPMRKAAEALLAEYDHFISIHGSSEASNLKADSIDLIVCARHSIGSTGQKLRRNFSALPPKEPICV